MKIGIGIKILGSTLLFSVLQTGICAIPTFTAQSALTNWLNNHDQVDYSQCVQGAGKQAQILLEMNPQLSNADFTDLNNGLLLQCLYGLTLVNQALCLGQASGCQAIALLVPTSAQIQAQAAQNTATNSTPTSTANSNIY